METGISFGILGPLEVRVSGRPLALPARKPRALLALLLLEANRVVPSERLVDTLWVEHPPASAANALQVYVAQLRKALDAGRELIVTRPPGYLLALEPNELDLDRFERLAAQGRDALERGELAAAAGYLRTALDLWRGPPLEDLRYETCLQTAILRLDELRVAVLEQRIDAELGLGRHGALVLELEQLVLEHPLREILWSQLMLALYRSGRQADALAAYQAARTRLGDELGLEPSPALRRLEQAILAQDRALEPAPAYPGSSAALVPERGVLLVVEHRERLPGLLELGRALADNPPRELILVTPLSRDDDLTRASAELNRERTSLLADGLAARAAAFVSDDPGEDVMRLATRLDIDLVLVEAPPELLDDGLFTGVAGELAAEAPSDVAVISNRAGGRPHGPVLVPFGGGEHEWSALEIGAWMARARGCVLRLAGSAPRKGRRDASRMLADASLAVQHALGIPPEPVLVDPGPEGLLETASDTSALVLGLPDRWRTEGLGATRLAVARGAPAPVMLVRNGVRPGGLAPGESQTRYTWSLDPTSAGPA